MLGLYQGLTKPDLCQVFKALRNNFKYFKLTRQAPDNLKQHLACFASLNRCVT
jgi:hypothetical protein